MGIRKSLLLLDESLCFHMTGQVGQMQIFGVNRLNAGHCSNIPQIMDCNFYKKKSMAIFFGK
jgi:hypothetical protein